MDCLALHGHEGLKYTKGVKDEGIGNEGEVGKESGLSMIVLLLTQVLGLLLIFERTSFLLSLFFLLKNLIEFEILRLCVER